MINPTFPGLEINATPSIRVNPASSMPEQDFKAPKPNATPKPPNHNIASYNSHKVAASPMSNKAKLTRRHKPPINERVANIKHTIAAASSIV
jgi:hypothetical protein